MSPEIHIHRSPSRCPYCKDAIDDVREVVACASCGARHHSECRATHGRCAICASVELLVYTPPPAAAAAPPQETGGLSVERVGEATVYTWPLFAKEGLALVPITGFLRLEPDGVTFVALEARRFFTVQATRAEVGEVVHVGRRLLVDVGDEERQVATESIGHALGAEAVALLAGVLEAWRRA